MALQKSRRTSDKEIATQSLLSVNSVDPHREQISKLCPCCSTKAASSSPRSRIARTSLANTTLSVGTSSLTPPNMSDIGQLIHIWCSLARKAGIPSDSRSPRLTWASQGLVWISMTAKRSSSAICEFNFDWNRQNAGQQQQQQQQQSINKVVWHAEKSFEIKPVERQALCVNRFNSSDEPDHDQEASPGRLVRTSNRSAVYLEEGI